MPQSCKICIHTSRRAIDAALLANRDSLRVIAAQYHVSKSALWRHFNSHLVPVQGALPQPIGEPQQVSEPGQVIEPQTALQSGDLSRS